MAGRTWSAHTADDEAIAEALSAVADSGGGVGGGLRGALRCAGVADGAARTDAGRVLAIAECARERGESRGDGMPPEKAGIATGIQKTQRHENAARSEDADRREASGASTSSHKIIV